MGVAAYNRGSALIRKQIRESARPIEFEIMDRLNALEKYSDAGTPFSDVRISYSHGVFWILDPCTDFGYWYKTINELMRRWNISIIGYSHGDWLCTIR